MKFILMVVIAMSNLGGVQGGDVGMHEFATKEACEAAAKRVIAEAEDLGMMRRVRAWCQPAG